MVEGDAGAASERPGQGVRVDTPARPLTAGETRRSPLARWVWPGALAVAAWAAGIAVLAGYTAGLGYEIAQPSAPPAHTRLASWLAAHHLRYGLSGYWLSSSVTVNSDNKVQVRALMQYTLQRDLWMSKVDWYDPTLHYANFIVLDSQPGNFSHWQPTALVRKYFGVPVQTYRTGPYTIMVWTKNLLESIPG